jgi:hypothetical protein
MSRITVVLAAAFVIAFATSTLFAVRYARIAAERGDELSLISQSQERLRRRDVELLDQMCDGLASLLEQDVHLDHRDVPTATVYRFHLIGGMLSRCLPNDAVARYRRDVDNAIELNLDPWRPNGAWVELGAALRVVDNYYKIEGLGSPADKDRHPPLREDASFFERLPMYETNN